MMIVRSTQIKKHFTTTAGTVQVLRGVDFEASAGNLTMIVGPSGCGKTTFVSLIAGLMRSDSGSLKVCGQDLTKLTQRGLAKFRLVNIGFVFQQFNLLPGLTARENVAVPLVANAKRWDYAIKKSDAILARLGMTEHSNRRPCELSIGQQQKIAIARALIHEPKLLICDEPTGALDRNSGQAVMTILRELAVHEHRTAIVVTHDPRVYEYADQIVHMEDGIVAAVEHAHACTRNGQSPLQFL